MKKIEGGTEMNGFICGPRVYQYNGWTFEFGYGGPWPMKKDGELRKNMGRKFFKDTKGWFNMDDKRREKYRVGGGCQAL